MMTHEQSSTSTRAPRKDYCYRRRGKFAPPELPEVHPNAAAVDVGAGVHYVSVPEDRDPEPVRHFGCFTAQLEEMARWLKACGIDTVVLESTGVYWVSVFRVLEEHGIEVLLVDARHVHYVPGRKTDVLDCQWLRRLHAVGLLSGAFVAPQAVEAMRTYWRQRRELVESAAREILHMQKALTQMNLRLNHVLADISGLSGMKIIRAMVAGERDALKLARLAHPSVKSTEDQRVQALTGHYRDEQLFVLKQSLTLYDIFQERIAECDRQLEAHLATMPNRPPRPEPRPAAPAQTETGAAADTGPAPAVAPAVKRSKRTRRKNEPHFDLRAELVRLTGTDLTRIDGIDALTAFSVCSEIGFGVEAFPDEKHFCSWLGLCPNNAITGGKVKRRRTKRTKNRAADALRVAAQSLHHSKSYLGAYYRHMRARLGAPKAITATAHKLARLVYAMLKYGEAYVDKGQEHLEREHRERRRKSVVRQARELGIELVDPATGEILTAVA